jgi:hypothetical protein
MGKRVKIQTAYTVEELHERYRRAKDAVERTHWHILWRAVEGKTPQTIAEQLGYTARWIRTVIGRWQRKGSYMSRVIVVIDDSLTIRKMLSVSVRRTIFIKPASCTCPSISSRE